MISPQTLTAASAAGIIATGLGGVSVADASDCAPAWVERAFVMNAQLMPCINRDVMNVARPVFSSRYRLRPKGSLMQRTRPGRRARSKNRSRLVVASAALRPPLPTHSRMVHLATSKHKSHWGYRSDNGPAKWSTLDEKFGLCGVGRQQSPINIAAAAKGTSTTISFDYKGGPATVVNNGHTVQVNVSRGNRMRVGDRVYRLVQFHFHTPSENTIDGLHYPMETHLVHKDTTGRLAVIALMVRAGRRGILDSLPQPTKNGGKADAGSVNPSDLIPVSKEHYVFKGSLTTPPCSEGVDWFVMKQPIEASHATIASLYAILGANNRPTNPLNGRSIKLSQ